MNIHDVARQMVQQRRASDLSEALSMLARRRKRKSYGVVQNSPELDQHLCSIAPPRHREQRLPYRDD